VESPTISLRAVIAAAASKEFKATARFSLRILSCSGFSSAVATGFILSVFPRSFPGQTALDSQPFPDDVCARMTYSPHFRSDVYGSQTNSPDHRGSGHSGLAPAARITGPPGDRRGCARTGRARRAFSFPKD